MANNVSRYQPQSSLTRLPDLMDRLFQESFVLPSVLDRYQGGTARSVFPVNLFETEDGYVLQAGLPGINPESIDIQVTGREVTLAGRFEVTAPEKVNWLWQGIPTGEFRESYTLPAEIDGAKTVASYEYGILAITLPKAEHLRPRNVKVAVKK